MIKTANKFSTMLLGLAMAFSGFLMSCEGPEGPAGPAGTKGDTGATGKDGKDGITKCQACHSDAAADVNLKTAQYNLSKHGTGEVYLEEAGRIGCGGCHSGDGFREAIALGKDDPTSLATSKINCKTCHTIHKAYDSTDWKLSFSSAFNLRFKGLATDANVDFKTGNLCGKCHQARTYTRTPGDFDTISAASSTSSYSRFGPHYGTVANVFAMKGLNNIEGKEYSGSNPHANLAKGCVSCHMGKNSTNPAAGGHTFQMSVAQMGELTECKTCHSTGIPTAKATQIKALLAEYRQLLINKSLLDTTQALGEEGYNVLGEYAKLSAVGKKTAIKKADGDALLNYLYLAKDRSNGAHNPGYVLFMLQNGVDYLKK